MKEARLCRENGGGEKPPQNVPPAIEAPKAPNAIPPAAEETPQSAQEATQNAVYVRGVNLTTFLKAQGQKPAAASGPASPEKTGGMRPATAEDMAKLKVKPPDAGGAPANQPVNGPADQTTETSNSNPPRDLGPVEDGSGRHYYAVAPGSAPTGDREASNNAPAQTPDSQKKAAEGAAQAAEQAQQAVPEAGNGKGDRVNAAVENLKSSLEGKDMGKFLEALGELIASIKAIFKPESETPKDQTPAGTNRPPESGANAPPASPEGAPGAPETGGEKQSERRDRVRKEVKDAGSVDEFKKNKEQTRDQKMQEYDLKIDAEQAQLQTVDDVNDATRTQIADKEQKASDPRLKPEQKADLEKEIRDLKVNLKAGEEHAENNRKDIKEMTDQRNKVHADAETDIKEVDAMIKEGKDKVQNITKQIENMVNSPEGKKNLEAQAILSGMTLTFDEHALDVSITLTPQAKQALIDLGGKLSISIQPIFDLASGVAPISAPPNALGNNQSNQASANSDKSPESNAASAERRTAKGLARVAGRLGQIGGINPKIIEQFEANGDVKSLTTLIVDALKSEKFPVYIAENKSLYANESTLGIDSINPDTQISNANFENYLMTAPESALRDLGQYANRANKLNPDTRGFLYELSTAYEQGARAA